MNLFENLCSILLSCRARYLIPALLLCTAWRLFLPDAAFTQDAVPRIMKQDPALNNLIDPPGYRTASPDTLGAVIEVGQGPETMILIPGLGFGAHVFDAFMESRKDAYTMYAVTLPGFGGTAAVSVPAEDVSFGAQTWTHAAMDAIKKLMNEEGMNEVVLVGHWLTGTQIALQLAMDDPKRVKSVVLLAGTARFVTATPNPNTPDDSPLAQRVAVVDNNLAPRWFKTVTRETWDDNNFLPGDYAAHPVLGLRHWREAARPPLHVWVRFLCEFFAQDITLELDRLQTPTLLLRPGLEGIYYPPGNNYLAAYLHRSWGEKITGHNHIEVQTIPDTRIIMWADQPGMVSAAVDDFLRRVR